MDVYTATIIRNFRDVHTMYPKVLLMHVRCNGKDFRDHCWVTLTNELEKVVPYKNHQKLRISFEAEPKLYQTLGPEKTTLTNIKNITIVRNK